MVLHNLQVLKDPAAYQNAPPPTVADPWEQYWTSVVPNSQLGFASDTIGWEVVGQGWGPSLDRNLSAGTPTAAWPGTEVLASIFHGQHRSGV
jgi:hypothetical protein